MSVQEVSVLDGGACGDRGTGRSGPRHGRGQRPRDREGRRIRTADTPPAQARPGATDRSRRGGAPQGGQGHDVGGGAARGGSTGGVGAPASAWRHWGSRRVRHRDARKPKDRRRTNVFGSTGRRKRGRNSSGVSVSVRS